MFPIVATMIEVVGVKELLRDESEKAGLSSGMLLVVEVSTRRPNQDGKKALHGTRGHVVTGTLVVSSTRL